MPFEKGVSGNPRGRPKKVQAKTKEELRDFYREILSRTAPDVEKWIRKVAVKNPAKATELYLQLSERVLPKIQSADVSVKHQIAPPQLIIQRPTEEHILNEAKDSDSGEAGGSVELSDGQDDQ